MTTEIFWRLPLHGDGRSLSAEGWNRGDYGPPRKQAQPFARTGVRDGYTYYDHLAQIARAAQLARFDGVWLPFTAGGEDPVIVAGAFAREARSVRFVAGLRAALNAPVYSAKIANSFQRLSGGRLAWFLTTEPDPEGAWHGQHWSQAEQIARTSEFLDVARGFWNAAPFNYKGTYYEVEKGGFPPALQGVQLPRIYLSGESDEALALSARHADVHLLPVAGLEETRQRIATLDALAAAQGRKLDYGLDLEVIARHTEEDAQADLHALSPGSGALRAVPSVNLVGSYQQVAERLAAYVAAGVSSFVLSARPHLEEAYLIGERVLPLFRALTSEQARRRTA